MYIVITHSKSAQDRLVSDVLGVLTSFGSSNIILALPSDPTETIIPADDPAVKSSPSTQNRTAHIWKSQNATAIELLKWKWPMRNDIRHFPPSHDDYGNLFLVKDFVTFQPESDQISWQIEKARSLVDSIVVWNDRFNNFPIFSLYYVYNLTSWNI